MGFLMQVKERRGERTKLLKLVFVRSAVRENCLLFLGHQATLALHPQSNENPIKQETALLLEDVLRHHYGSFCSPFFSALVAVRPNGMHSGRLARCHPLSLFYLSKSASTLSLVFSVLPEAYEGDITLCELNVLCDIVS